VAAPLIVEYLISAMATKTALVTGGSAGIGKALALCLAEAGLDVLICGRREGPLTEVAAKHKNIRVCVADVSTAEGCAALKTSLADKPLHMLIHNAGVNCIGAFDTLDREKFRSTCAVNVEGPLFLTQALTANLQAAGGKARILIVSSGAGDMALPTMGGYCISKAAVKMAWMVMRDELAAVAAVGYCLPGLVESEITENMLVAEGFALKDFIAGRMKSGDIHTAAEVAEWIAALLDAKKCAADIFKTRVHNVDDKDHQLGVTVRLTMEAGLIEAAKEAAKPKAAPQGKKDKKKGGGEGRRQER